jgi:hypothetical protein
MSPYVGLPVAAGGHSPPYPGFIFTCGCQVVLVRTNDYDPGSTRVPSMSNQLHRKRRVPLLACPAVFTTSHSQEFFRSEVPLLGKPAVAPKSPIAFGKVLQT